MSDLPVTDLISVDQAIAILDSIPLYPQKIQLPISEAAGHRLAEDLFSDSDYPPFDKAVMDGFAVRAADASGPGASLKVIDTIAAGRVGQRSLQVGEAASIMTGAPLPAGADAVIPVEYTSRDGDRVVLQRPVKPDQAVARRGSDTPVNRLLLARGTMLGPAQIGVAASVGKAMVDVYARPEVALLATGDELVEIDRVPTGSQIRNSNSQMMRALLQQLGCTVKSLGIARDKPEEIRQLIVEGRGSDALFITGGMSMGDRDYVPGILRELGMELRISKLRIKPGKPFVFATGRSEGISGKNPAMVFGLPGNPVSAFVCTVRLASRILARLAGGAGAMEVESATLVGDLGANGPREFYLPAVRKGQSVQPLQPNGSADLFTLALANALIVRPENCVAAVAGNWVRVINL
jgi:molybdopterin molybdotransferase